MDIRFFQLYRRDYRPSSFKRSFNILKRLTIKITIDA